MPLANQIIQPETFRDPVRTERKPRGVAEAERVAKLDAKRREHQATESGLRRVDRSFLLTIYAPTPNDSNRSKGKHWGELKRIHDAQKEAVANALMVYRTDRPRFPVIVTMVRVSPHRLDKDGLGTSLKYVQDSVARWLHCDDGETDKVTFVPAQETGSYCVRVSIVPASSLLPPATAEVSR